jgi:hypothetical protein
MIMVTALLAFFTFYQFQVGNPFREGIHPAIITAVFTVMAGAALYVSFRGK